MMSITNTFLMITDSEIIEEKAYCEGTVPYTAQNMNLQKVSFLRPSIGQVSTSADRQTLNRFQSIVPYFNICSLPDLWEPLKQLRVAAAQGAEVPQLLQRRADQLLALPHLRPRHIF